jgi:hypothetical protein
MFERAWKIFFRTVVAIGFIFLCFIVVVVRGFSQPNVVQSTGYVERSDLPVDRFNRDSFPDSARKIRYALGSVGIGGRLSIYCFTAPFEDLHSHAKQMFVGVSPPNLSITPNSDSFFGEHELELVKEAFDVDASWMLPEPEAKGVLYTPASDMTSRMPRIFVDEKASVLYYMLTD